MLLNCLLVTATRATPFEVPVLCTEISYAPKTREMFDSSQAELHVFALQADIAGPAGSTGVKNRLSFYSSLKCLVQMWVTR